jgi:hypothetical protein
MKRPIVQTIERSEALMAACLVAIGRFAGTRQGVVAVVVFVLCCAAPAFAQHIVERRGDEPALRGRITLIDDGGVTIISDLGAVHTISWDRVRAVKGEVIEPDLDRWMEAGEKLWRARTRLERGDAALAEPLFERLFETYRGRTHETALMVAEGVLRCRLSRSENAMAVIPALEAARLRRANITTSSYAALPPAIDHGTALCPHVPPIWIASPASARLASELLEYDAQGDEVIAAIAALYRQAILQQLDEPARHARLAGPVVTRHPGVIFLRDVVESRSADASQREVARTRLVRRIDSLPEWGEAWARFHLGLSLLGESGEGRPQRGAVMLAHLPANHGGAQPYLAGLALAYMAGMLEASGQADGAASLRAELHQRFPHHPVHRAESEIFKPPARDLALND